VGAGYQDAGDFDDGPGVLSLPATGVEVFVFAGAGNDFVDASGLRSATANIYGQAGDDVLLGADTNSGYGDRIFGGPGSDSVWGLGGDDELDGEDDDDVVDGGIGNDRIAGGLGDDQLLTGIGRDRVDGGAGIDRTRFVGVGGGILVTSSDGRPVLMAAKDGSTVGLQGAAGIEAISVVGTDSVDVVMVLDTLPGVSLAVDAAGGDDRVLVGGFDPQGDAALQGDLARIVGAVVVSGGAGDDAIVFLDNATGVDRNYSVDPAGMQAVLPGRGGAAPVLVSDTLYGGVERVDLRGTNGRNRFDVIPGVDAGVAIDGGLPASGSVSAAEGDYLAIDTVSRFPVSNDGMDTSGRRLKITERGVGRWDFADTSAHKSVEFKSIERFNHVDRFAVGVGGGPGSRPSVRVFDAGTMTALFDIPASATYGNTFRNGVSVACGDMDNDGIPDVITAPGPGAKVVVKVFNGAPKVGVEGSEIVELRISEKDTFGKKYLGGANIAVGDVVGDGMRDIVVAPMRGRPVVKVYEGQLAAGSVSPTIVKVPVRTFNPFPGWHSYTGGASLTTARVDSSGRARIVVGSGAGMPTLIRDFDVRNAGVVIARTHVSVAPNCYGDVRVSAGDVDGDGVDDVLATVQAVGGTWMRARSGADGRTLLLSYQFTVTATSRPTQGILVDANADGKAEMFAALAGSSSAGPRVVRYRPLQGLSTDGKLHSIQISAPGRINLG
jgi:hypothetical protein